MAEIMDEPVRKRPERRRSFEVLTTGEVATICRVAPRTVSHWVDRGQLIGRRLPGSEHRRILRDDLIEFLTRTGMPLSWLAEFEGKKCPRPAAGDQPGVG